MHACKRTYVHAYIRTDILTYIHAYRHAYIHTAIHTSMQTSTQTYMHTYIHAYIRTYIHASMQPYIHIYICIYAHASLDRCMFQNRPTLWRTAAWVATAHSSSVSSVARVRMYLTMHAGCGAKRSAAIFSSSGRATVLVLIHVFCK